MVSVAASFLILVGSYTPYISTLRFTPSGPSGASLSYVTQSVCGGSPTWVTYHPSNSSIIYATQELYYASGMLYSLVLDRVSGALSQVSSISTGTPSNAQGTVYTQTIQNGTALAAANYNAGSAFFVSLSSDYLHFSGSGQVVQYTGHGPGSNQLSAHAHDAVEYGSEVLVADLGSDMVWRMKKSGSSWSQAGSIPFTAGSGPRHLVPINGNLYTLHQNYNALTQHTLPSLDSAVTPSLIANISIIPPDTPSSATSNMQAAELLYAESTCGGDASPLLYASNRNDPSSSGDAITVFETTPSLKAVAYVRTGLQHIRGMAFVGNHNEYIVAGGMNGGGIKVYKRVSSCLGYLQEVASLPAGQVSQPTGFTWASSA